jgi:hypothetical protein
MHSPPSLATIDPKNLRFEPTTMHYYTTIDQKKWNLRTHDHALHYDRLAPQKLIRTHDHALSTIDPQMSDSNPRPCTTPPTIDPQNVRDSRPQDHALTPPFTPKMTRIRTHDHALYHWPQKRPIRTHDHALCHWPKKGRFELMTMHYTTNEPKSRIRTHHALHHHWPPRVLRWPQYLRSTPPLPPVTSKSKRFEPKTMHYTTIDPQKDEIRTPNHALPGMKAGVTFFRWISRYVHVHMCT